MIIKKNNIPDLEAAIKDLEEKRKQYEDAMKANADATKEISKGHGVDTKKKTISNKSLKAMHLSESLFEDVPDDEECADCAWCGYSTPIDELYKTDIGLLCSDCIEEIRSRGESITIFYESAGLNNTTQGKNIPTIKEKFETFRKSRQNG